jgi:hypothetical protein
MHERILKNEEDFVKWKSDYLCDSDTVEDPVKYPCYAKTRVSNWNYQEETAEYLYVEDIENILKELNT